VRLDAQVGQAAGHLAARRAAAVRVPCLGDVVTDRPHRIAGAVRILSDIAYRDSALPA
jgi:hypothetical protein